METTAYAHDKFNICSSVGDFFKTADKIRKWINIIFKNVISVKLFGLNFIDSFRGENILNNVSYNLF